MRKLFFATLIAAVLGFSTYTNAALVDNGGGLFYDTDLNITWLQEPNNSMVIWGEADAWAKGLTVGGTAAGTWRLPMSDTCTGYNCTGSEMGHLYYVELGNTQGSLSNKGPFVDLKAFDYWANAYGSGAWYFSFANGYQQYSPSQGVPGWAGAYALAAHEGNVAHAPIPGAILLFAPSLVGLIGLRRKYLG